MAVAPSRIVGEEGIGRGSANSWKTFPLKDKLRCRVLPLRVEGVRAGREGRHAQRGDQGVTEGAGQGWERLAPPFPHLLGPSLYKLEVYTRYLLCTKHCPRCWDCQSTKQMETPVLKSTQWRQARNAHTNRVKCKCSIG